MIVFTRRFIIWLYYTGFALALWMQGADSSIVVQFERLGNVNTVILLYCFLFMVAGLLAIGRVRYTAPLVVFPQYLYTGLALASAFTTGTVVAVYIHFFLALVVTVLTFDRGRFIWRN